MPKWISNWAKNLQKLNSQWYFLSGITWYAPQAKGSLHMIVKIKEDSWTCYRENAKEDMQQCSTSDIGENSREHGSKKKKRSQVKKKTTEQSD